MLTLYAMLFVGSSCDVLTAVKASSRIHRSQDGAKQPQKNAVEQVAVPSSSDTNVRGPNHTSSGSTPGDATLIEAKLNAQPPYQ